MPDQPTVIVVPGQSTPQESENSSSEPKPETGQAIAFGQMTESFRQAQERQAQLEAELIREREARQAMESQLATVSTQTSQILDAINRAAEEEATEPDPDVVAITPAVEPEPTPEPEPERKAGLFERICERINGM